MVPYIGDFVEDATVYLMFNTFTSNDPSASSTITNFANTDVHIHKDDGLTQRNNAAGITVSIDFDSITGSHMIKVDTSNDTVAGFWVAGHDYFVRVEGTTVDAATINAVVGHFSIENRSTTVIASDLVVVDGLVDTIKSDLIVLDGIVDGEVTKTTTIASDVVVMDALIDTVKSDLIVLDAIIDGEVTKTATIASDLILVDTVVDTIASDLIVADAVIDTVASDLVVIDALIDTVKSDLIVLDAIVDGEVTKTATIASDLILVDTVVDTVASDLIVTDAIADTIKSDLIVLDAIVDGLNDISVANITSVEVDNDGTAISLAGALKLLLSVCTGKSSGGGSATAVFRDIADSKNRISATVDANGNRTAIGTRDAS